MNTHAEKVWGAAQNKLQGMLTQEIFNLWFAPIKARQIEGDTLTLEVPNNYFEAWLKDNYLALIQDILSKNAGETLKVRFLAKEEALAPMPHLPRRAEVVEEPEPEASREFPLNPRNTFDTFVVGNNNTFAHAAAIAVAQTPGKSYNPLFVYSSVGLGKTRHWPSRRCDTQTRESGLCLVREIHERVHRCHSKQSIGPFSPQIPAKRRIPD
jgi:chromosomal replication initiator protein